MDMENWYGTWGFEENPYAAKPPERIDAKRFVWDRPDLPEARDRLTEFMQDVKNRELTGLMAYGDVGSGKTWLNRFIQIELIKELPELLVVETRVPNLQADFKAVYGTFITNLLSESCPLRDRLLKANESVEDFLKFFDSEDLGRAMYHICKKDGAHVISRNWLLDRGVSTANLGKADISTKIGENYIKVQIIEDILSNSLKIFSGIVFCADQLEQSSAKFARQLSDGFRDIMDSLGRKLAMCCFFQAQDADDWYTMGYSGPLFTRLRHKIRLGPIHPDHISDFLRLHNKAYRSVDHKVDDDLVPFTDSGARDLVKSMKPERAFPRSIFHNCHHLARKAFEKKAETVDEDFVQAHLGGLEELAAQKQL